MGDAVIFSIRRHLKRQHWKRRYWRLRTHVVLRETKNVFLPPKLMSNILLYCKIFAKSVSTQILATFSMSAEQGAARTPWLSLQNVNLSCVTCVQYLRVDPQNWIRREKCSVGEVQSNEMRTVSFFWSGVFRKCFTGGYSAFLKLTICLHADATHKMRDTRNLRDCTPLVTSEKNTLT